MHILIKNKFLIYNNYKVKCALGKRGIGKKKKEGDSITPIGLFKIKYLLYRKDKIKKIKTKLKKIVIRKNMGWCDDPKSKQYNKLIKLPNNYSYERLYKKSNIYDIVLVLNYNIRPVRKNKGSAIFIHIATNNYSSTKGCVAIRRKILLKIIKEITNKTKVKISNRK
jgi:L,D-peptidoglycan transpeptidase YkuD (ErfK/YbiS/YcfS/YnhG family)